MLLVSQGPDIHVLSEGMKGNNQPEALRRPQSSLWRTEPLSLGCVVFRMCVLHPVRSCRWFKFSDSVFSSCRSALCLNRRRITSLLFAVLFLRVLSRLSLKAFCEALKAVWRLYHNSHVSFKRICWSLFTG